MAQSPLKNSYLPHQMLQRKKSNFVPLCPVFPKLVHTMNAGLHMMVILFLLVAMAFALVSLSFCIYNARKVPYQSIKGHKGIYLWNCIAGMPLNLFLFYTVSSYILHL